MYTIKQASLRTGVSIPLLRAWERRYGIPTPARTASQYRLYDDAALDAVRRMHALVESGWAPRQAADAILEGRDVAPGENGTAGASERGGAPATGEARATGPAAAAGAEGAAGQDGNGSRRPDSIPIEVGDLSGPAIDWLLGATARARALGEHSGSGEELVERFVAAARDLDEAALEEVLDEAIAGLGVDAAISTIVLPSLVAVGEGWVRGEVDVASEHAASSAVMRRLGTLYEAAGERHSEPDVVVGLPPHGRHEGGALAFALAARRAGLGVLYLGADVPVESWIRVAREHPRAAIVLGAVTAAEAESTAAVAAALRQELPDRVIAAGGASAAAAAAAAGNGLALLDGSLRESVAAVRRLLHP